MIVFNWYKDGGISGVLSPPYRVPADCDPTLLWVSFGNAGSEVTIDVFADGVSILNDAVYLHRGVLEYETEDFVADTTGVTIEEGAIITVSVVPDKASPEDISIQLILEEA